MFKVTNIKVSLKIKFVCLDTVQKTLKNSGIEFKSYMNFLVFKHIYTYILFKSKNTVVNHLNITNIKNHEDILNAIIKLQDINIISTDSVVSQTVDNITASFSIITKFKFTDILTKFKSISKVTYNNEKFPGIFLKFDIGTVIIFHTGKCIIIGCKSTENIECLVKIVHANI